MPLLKFTVDAALLEELGERLVGRPYIALAELVKNGYDADATEVTISLDPKNGAIEVYDNGHGMDLHEFKDFWMRIGSTHKQLQRISRHFGRLMAGSKGVGRLSVQYLAYELNLRTTSEKNLNSQLVAHVNWKQAVSAGDLTEATVEYEIKSRKEPFGQGTLITLRGLKEPWNKDLVEGLAKEIWWLQPPFRGNQALEFRIEFVSPEEDYVQVFNEEMHAILDIWHARLVGKNKGGEVTASLEFADRPAEPMKFSYSISEATAYRLASEMGIELSGLHGSGPGRRTAEEDVLRELKLTRNSERLKCKLDDGSFEIRIYHLRRRQPHGITVAKAREYLNKYGGVHVYDGGFHLPYYGDQRNDWLKVEQDHSHRLSVSELLPKELQVPSGMSFLPTLSRILGVVNVKTSEEPDLNILITRDRLQETRGFENLRDMARYALDFYAQQEAKREAGLKEEVEKPKTQKIDDVLAKHQSEIPKEAYISLRRELKKAAQDIETEAESTVRRIALMGSLATAGISTVAYQHELRQQFSLIRSVVRQIAQMKTRDLKIRRELDTLENVLSSWLERAEMTNALFAYLGDPENLKHRRRFSARKVVQEIADQVKLLSRGIQIDTNQLEEDSILPKASLAEWSSIFQNVFINAFNAMLDSKKKLIDVSSKRDGRKYQILVQDTGCGVDLNDAEQLFQPFERRVTISPERRALGYGGTGLGLTIVRLVAHNIGCKVSFVKPEKAFSTAFCIEWRETE